MSHKRVQLYLQKEVLAAIDAAAAEARESRSEYMANAAMLRVGNREPSLEARVLRLEQIVLKGIV